MQSLGRAAHLLAFVMILGTQHQLPRLLGRSETKVLGILCGSALRDIDEAWHAAPGPGLPLVIAMHRHRQLAYRPQGPCLRGWRKHLYLVASNAPRDAAEHARYCLMQGIARCAAGGHDLCPAGSVRACALRDRDVWAHVQPAMVLVRGLEGRAAECRGMRSMVVMIRSV